ncbi:chemotaxis protein MotB [Anaerotaenia torta]|uniref:OmpA/MotB family protein n=1 Tax=Anaerotaenia torta TaxID=433293 RepID=UPI003D2272D1
MRSKFSDMEDDDDGEEADWKDSYSDLMTDLLAVFVLLLSFAMINQSAANRRTTAATEIMQMIGGADVVTEFANGESVMEGRDNVLAEPDASESSDSSFYESISEYIEKKGISDQLTVVKEGDDVLLRVAASVLFDPGKAKVTPGAKTLLQWIGEVLMMHEKYIDVVRIEGHTDNVPTNKDNFDSNWELSTTRAVNVLRVILETSGLDANKLSATGYSEYHPIASNKTEKGRALNRRVDFVIETVSEEIAGKQEQKSDADK